MRSYRSLVESLPSKTVVFTFGRFNPPSTGHQLLVQFIKKLARQRRAEHIVFASTSQDAKKNPISVDRKLHYLNVVCPNTSFAVADDVIAAVTRLGKRYRNLVMVTGSDCAASYDKELNRANGSSFRFDSIEVVSTGEIDPDNDDGSIKMRSLAGKGDFTEFKRYVPASMRDIDARRMMNDMREGMGLDAVKEQLNMPINTLREKYFRGEIYLVGQVVESINGEQFEIVKRGTNYLLVKDHAGKVVSKWLDDVIQGTQDE